MFVPEAVELRVDRMDLGPDLGIVLVGEPVPELGAVFAQSLDLGMDLFESSHDGFNGRHAHDIPAESSALPEENAASVQAAARASRTRSATAASSSFSPVSSCSSSSAVGF